MGRRSNRRNNSKNWKRRRYYKKNNKVDKHAQDVQEEIQGTLVTTSRSQVIRYLTEYRDGCISYYQHEYNCLMLEYGGQDTTATTNNKENDGPVENGTVETNNNKVTTEEHDPSVEEGEEEETWCIGGVQLPPLNDDSIFSASYLELPRELTKKQRKLIHECCVEVDLFHTSYDKSTGQRHVAISIYGDGFDKIPEWNKEFNRNSRIPALYQYRPWYYCFQDVATAATTTAATTLGTGAVGDDDKVSVEVADKASDDAKSSPKTTAKKKDGRVVTFADDTAAPDTPKHSNQSFSPKKKKKMDLPLVPPVLSSTSTEKRQQTEETHIQAIFRLIDQPGDCLRDNVDHLIHDTWIRASLAEVPPPSDQASTWMLVDTPATWQQCLHELELSQPTELAFDVESYNVNKYTQMTCLVQITTNFGKEYVLDPLAPGMWDCMVHDSEPLAQLLANPNVVKIGHAIAGLDIRSLHRDFGWFVVNCFDTYEAAKILALDSQGLTGVCAHYGLPAPTQLQYQTLKAEYQTCDWRERPLTEDRIRYARYDVHYLVRLRKLMMRDLVRDAFWSSSRREEERLAATSMKNFVAEMARVEDGVPATPRNSAVLSDDTTPIASKTIMDVMQTSIVNMSEIEDDAQSFKSTRSRLEDDAFYTPPSSVRGLSFSDDDDDIPEDDEQDISVSQLRLQPLLMTCLTTSQERCREIWSDPVEPHFKNSLYNSLVARWRKNEVSWHPSSTELFDDLFRWRAQVAWKFQCLPGFIAPIDLLVLIAWKRPTTEMSLRRINYQLPDFLEENTEYLDQMLEMVLSRSLVASDVERLCIFTPTSVYFYSNLDDSTNLSTRSRGLGLLEPEGDTYGHTLFKLAVAGTLGAAVGLALKDANERHGLVKSAGVLGGSLKEHSGALGVALWAQSVALWTEAAKHAKHHGVALWTEAAQYAKYQRREWSRR